MIREVGYFRDCSISSQTAESTTPTIEFMTFLATGVASPSLVYFLNRELGFKVNLIHRLAPMMYAGTEQMDQGSGRWLSGT